MLDFLDRIVRVTVGALVATTAVAVCLNVFFRYVLNSGLVWADEIPGFLLVWIAFLGAYLAARDDGHIAFDMLVDAFPRGLRRVVRALGDLAVTAFFVLLGVTSWQMIARVGGRSIETLPIDQGIFMGVLPLASGLMVIAMLARLIDRWRNA